MPDDLTFSEPLLEPADEIALARQIEAGVLSRELLDRPVRDCPATPAELACLVRDGEAAQRRLIEANLRLVIMVSGPAATRAGQLNPSDLFQEGCLGLLTAVQRFDHRRGCRFATYALYWIRAFVGAASATRLGELNLPSGRAGDLRVFRGAAEAVGQLLGREPTPADVAAALGRPSRWTERLLTTRAPVSLQGSAADRLETMFAPEDEHWVGRPDPDLEARRRLVRRLLAALPEVEREVLGLRLGLGGDPPLSRSSVAAQLRCSASRVQRLETRALDRLRGLCPASARDLLSA